MKPSRRKKLEKIALERLMAHADDPYDYLWGEGASTSDQSGGSARRFNGMS